MKGKRFMIIGILILLISLVGSLSTYAWFTWSSTNNTSLTMTIGESSNVIFSTGNDISTNKLSPVFNYTDGEKTSFVISNKTNTSFTYKILLNITSIDNELKNGELKYKLLSNDSIVNEGDFTNIEEQNILYEGELSKSKVSYTFYLYIDGNMDNDINMINKSIKGSITVEESEKTVNLATYITNLYTNAEKNTITNNSIEYNVATSVNLMNDRLGGTTTSLDGGNIRYYGASPNNYIYFNCSDYSNQSDTTCEKWRIIGVFDGKVKLIRNESIGNFSYDNSVTYGSNVWLSSKLMKLLNPNYTGTGGSLYWNSKSGNCYSGQSTNKTKACNFTTIGLKNDITRNIIVNGKWYNGQRTSSFQSVAEAYAKEITTTINSYVGLAVSSDYGYAVDLNKCIEELYLLSSTICKTNNWMTSVFPASTSWLLTPGQGENYNWVIDSKYQIDGVYYSYYEHNVLPVVYLDSNIKINNKEKGSITDPYKIIIENTTEESRVPKEYQEVEYISSTGTEYIKTNISCNYNDTVKMVSIGNFNFTNDAAWQGVNAHLQHNITSSKVSDGVSSLTLSDDEEITVSYDGNTHKETITVGSSTNQISRTWKESNYGGYVTFLKMSDKDSIYSTTGVRAKLKGGKIYVDNILKVDLVPVVRQSDNVAGMYDIINNTFYTNSGTGTFGIGNNVN